MGVNGTRGMKDLSSRAIQISWVVLACVVLAAGSAEAFDVTVVAGGSSTNGSVSPYRPSWTRTVTGPGKPLTAPRKVRSLSRAPWREARGPSVPPGLGVARPPGQESLPEGDRCRTRGWAPGERKGEKASPTPQATADRRRERIRI